MEDAHQDAVLANGALLPDFEGDEDPDELLSDEDAPDLQDEIAKTLTSLKACTLRFLPLSFRIGYAIQLLRSNLGCLSGVLGPRVPKSIELGAQQL